MPFRPLPQSLLTDLLSLNSESRVLELGSGQGEFGQLLEDNGVSCLGLDLRHGTNDTVCDLVGDARKAPIRRGSVSLLIAANLSRHLTPRHQLLKYIASWRELLAPSGTLYIFEDEPSASLPSERNYRDLQAFLARLMPESRGPLITLDRFRKMVASSEDVDQWQFGCQTNQVDIDATAVVRFLAAGQGSLSGKEAGLLRSIGRDGVRPGRFWWARVGPPAVESEGT